MSVHEAGRLHLQIDKAKHRLGWQPRWPFGKTVQHTVGWYKAVQAGNDPTKSCINDIKEYNKESKPPELNQPNLGRTNHNPDS